MRQDERETLRQQFQFRCGYCGVRERDAGAELTVDHFQPSSQGGLHEAQNWVYCCHACNEFKGDHWQPDSPRRILHPLRDATAPHLVEEEDGTVRALTETGAFHIERLHLNRVNSSHIAANAVFWGPPANRRPAFSKVSRNWKNK